jgi:hypothetical protein
MLLCRHGWCRVVVRRGSPPPPPFVSYISAKGALNGFTSVVAANLAGRGDPRRRPPHESGPGCGQVGFAGGTSLREHLHVAIGVSPLVYRRTFRGVPAQNH